MDIKFKARMMGISPRLIAKTDPRRLQELMDARMIQEDQHAMANCPTIPINREFHHSYVNPYDDHAAITPLPFPRNHRYDGGEDEHSFKADQEAGDY